MAVSQPVDTEPSPAAAAESSYDFSSVIFNEQFSDGTDFSPSRWRDNRSEPESCASYDWGVFTHDTHSVSNSVGHVLWRKRATPLKGFQNRFDKEPTLRYVDQAFVTTQGLFSFVYGSLETRARFPQSAEGLFAGLWLRAGGACHHPGTLAKGAPCEADTRLAADLHRQLHERPGRHGRLRRAA